MVQLILLYYKAISQVSAVTTASFSCCHTGPTASVYNLHTTCAHMIVYFIVYRCTIFQQVHTLSTMYTLSNVTPPTSRSYDNSYHLVQQVKLVRQIRDAFNDKYLSMILWPTYILRTLISKTYHFFIISRFSYYHLRSWCWAGLLAILAAITAHDVDY